MEAACIKVWWLGEALPVSQFHTLFRPWLMEQVLATISAGHQKAAWGVAGIDTGTQVKKIGSHKSTMAFRISDKDSYEAALNGP